MNIRTFWSSREFNPSNQKHYLINTLISLHKEEIPYCIDSWVDSREAYFLNTASRTVLVWFTWTMKNRDQHCKTSAIIPHQLCIGSFCLCTEALSSIMQNLKRSNQPLYSGCKALNSITLIFWDAHYFIYNADPTLKTVIGL